MASTINASNSGFGGIVSTGDSSGQLQLQTASTTAVTIDTSQNVGIGTTSPGTKFNVYTNSATNTFGRVQNTLGYVDFGPLSDGSIYAGYSAPAASTSMTFGTSNSTPILLYTNASERMRISATAANLILSGGNTSATGTGITFPATQSASTDANCLDDYEEGTWTPTSDTGFPTGFTGVTATYTKVGRMVFFTATMTATADGTTIQIGGLPFSAAAAGGVVFGYWGSNILKARTTSSVIQMVTSATFGSTSVQIGGVYSV